MKPRALGLVLLLAGMAAAPISVPLPLSAQTSLLEVEKGQVKLMQINEDGGLVVRGTEDPGPIPASGGGSRLMWYPSKYAFRVGLTGNEWDDLNIGSASVAMGQSTTASGLRSTALGGETVASGLNSTALGSSTTASGESSTSMGFRTTAGGSRSTAMGEGTRATGDGATAMGQETNAIGGGSTATGFRTEAGGVRSTAMGFGAVASGPTATAFGAGTVASGSVATAFGNQTEASGEASTAMGRETRALGIRSTAMGYQTTASGERSTAMGSNANAAGAGSFAYGDASSDQTVAAVANMFVVRASGGINLRTAPDQSTGCNLQGLGGTWQCTSSRLAKEGFADMDGELVLDQLADMPIQRWRYRGTDQWHVGPAAEDFHAAFELGEGPTTISTVDADGISLLAVQALERRTDSLRAELDELRRMIQTGRVAP